MSERKFNFVSPGIEIAEIDNSQVPKTSRAVGPIVIGRARRGPGLRPVTVESFSEWINIYGNPVPGGQGGDIWREGNYTGPMYGTFAAQAWLKNNSPLTYVRLLGASHEDAATAGAAGWETKDSSGVSTDLETSDAGGGAYGLFLINSSSDDGRQGVPDSTPATGTLAAVWYLNQGSVVLSGTLRDGSTASGSALLVKSLGSDKEFKAIIRDGNSIETKTTTFNFSRTSKKYIRKVFNTNPTLANGSISAGANTASYWLGETFERAVDDHVTNNSAGTVFGIIMGLKGNSSAKRGSNFRMSTQAGQTGWFFSQDLNIVGGAANSYNEDDMTKLFKFHCLDTGDGAQKEVKIAIQDIKASTNPANPYGVFSVVLRKVGDTDNAPLIVERFSSCDLNPWSENYVAKKIGDAYVTWDDEDRMYREYGNHKNQSKFVRIEMNADVDAGAVNSELLPFGVFGPIRHRGFSLLSGSDNPFDYGTSIDPGDATLDFAAAFVKGGGVIARDSALGTDFANLGGIGSAGGGRAYPFTGAFVYPAIPLRASSSVGNMASPKDAYWGADPSISSTSARIDPGYNDLVRPMPAGYGSFALSAAETEYSWIFSLDNLTGSGATQAIYSSGSRAAGTSLTAVASTNYKDVLTKGFNRFVAPMYGGFDGLDITEKEPFNNTDLEGGTQTTNYAWNSVNRAIDCVKDPEVVEGNLVTAPGITNEALTDHILSVSEDRRDLLAIIDLKGGFIPSTENTSGDSAAANRGDVDTTISNLEARGINSSYGCAYYPWVQIRDTIAGSTLWAPPSIIGLGTMAGSEKKTELWFAPAGFNRGGLSEGAAGIPVVGVRERLTKGQRDKLYEANINPIASFPNEGIVVFGQKTLQVTQSALDRINVRRLLIYLKKEISRIAASVLFDPNIQVTWNRFIGPAERLMRSVKIRFGLADYKIKLDAETTTPDLIDRNIMYAKIFLKPTRAIEFIGVDFVITDSGASFED